MLERQLLLQGLLKMAGGLDLALEKSVSEDIVSVVKLLFHN